MSVALFVAFVVAGMAAVIAPSLLPDATRMSASPSSAATLFGSRVSTA